MITNQLFGAIVFGILGMEATIGAPVAGIPLAPGLLGTHLVVYVVLVRVAFELLPAASTFTLTGFLGTEGLIRVLWAWQEKFAASKTGSIFHDHPPTTIPLQL